MRFGGLEKVVSDAVGFVKKPIILGAAGLILASSFTYADRIIASVANKDWLNRFSQLSKEATFDVTSYLNAFNSIVVVPEAMVGVDEQYSIYPVGSKTESNGYSNYAMESTTRSNTISNNAQTGVSQNGISAALRINSNSSLSRTKTTQVSKNTGRSKTIEYYVLNFTMRTKNNSFSDSVIENIFYSNGVSESPIAGLTITTLPVSGSKIVSVHINLDESQYEAIKAYSEGKSNFNPLIFRTEPLYRNSPQMKKMENVLKNNFSKIKIYDDKKFSKELYVLNGVSVKQALFSTGLFNEKEKGLVPKNNKNISYSSYDVNHIINSDVLRINIAESNTVLEKLLRAIDLVNPQNSSALWQTSSNQLKDVEVRWNPNIGTSMLQIYSRPGQFGIKERNIPISEANWRFMWNFPWFGKFTYLVSDHVIDMQSFEGDLYVAAKMYNKDTKKYRDYLFSIDPDWRLKDVEVLPSNTILGLGEISLNGTNTLIALVKSSYEKEVDAYNRSTNSFKKLDLNNINMMIAQK